MKKYTVTVKQIYTYYPIKAESKQEAIDLVIREEWRYCEDQIEVTAKRGE